MQEFFLARQPIVNRQDGLVAFELLFRSGQRNGVGVIDNARATAEVILNTFSETGIVDVLGTCRGFINVDASLLHSELIEILPRKKVVLELLETVTVDQALIRRCRELKNQGYSLALDDVVELERIKPLLPLADIVKLDVPQLGWAELAVMVKALRSHPVKLLAEKVEHPDQAELCRELGFDLFQGYHFAHPEVLTGKRVHPSKLALLEILTQMLNGADFDEIEKAFKSHPDMVYNLMRMVNSAALGLPSKISSLRHALAMLGKRPLQRWIQLLLYTSAGSHGGATPLMQMAATRGKLMELLVLRQHPHGNEEYADRAFMVGVLSLIDAVLTTPLPEIIARLRVHEEVESALLQRRGELGTMLELCEYLEQGDVGSLIAWQRNHPGLPAAALNQCELEAMAWANAIVF
jgi:EAL and modified HD-GYP domain-containing signal transduction protein